MKQTITDILESYRAGTTVRSVVQAAVAAMEHDSLNAIRSMHDRDSLLKEADEADIVWETIRSGNKEARLLEGMPIILKDNIAVRGELTGAGSKILDGYRIPYSATVTEKLRAAGAIILGKGNMDEFAMGSSGENSGYGPTKNPADPTRVTGGSSSGPTAAVAAGYVPAALGTDTGGSVRQPASLCGVVGLRPTYGRVSRFGVLAMASSLDQVSPLAHTVEDAARVLEAIAGRDPLDQTSQSFDDLRGLTDEFTASASSTSGESGPTPEEIPALRHLKVASFDGPANLEGLDPRVRELVSAQRTAFAHTVGITPTSFEAIVGSTVARDFLDLALDAYYIIVPAEVSSNLARYDGIRFGLHPKVSTLLDQYVQTRSQGFGAEAKRRIMLGTHVLSSGYYDAYYKTALKAQAYVEQQFEKVFEPVDILMGPTSPTVAFPIGEKVNDPLAMYLLDLYTLPVNIGGLCAISVPCGEVDGLPVGMQLIAKGGDERKLLSVARAFEAWRDQNYQIQKDK